MDDGALDKLEPNVTINIIMKLIEKENFSNDNGFQGNRIRV